MSCCMAPAPLRTTCWTPWPTVAICPTELPPPLCGLATLQCFAHSSWKVKRYKTHKSEVNVDRDHLAILHTCTSKVCLSLRIWTMSSGGQWVIEKLRKEIFACRSVKPLSRARLLIIEYERHACTEQSRWLLIRATCHYIPANFPCRREASINKLRTEMVGKLKVLLLLGTIEHHWWLSITVHDAFGY